MTWMDGSFRVADTPVSRVNCFGEAVAAQLRELYPHHTTKCVAQAMRCTPKAAENILDGKLTRRSATRLIEVFGPGFLAEAVMAAAGTTLINFIRTQAEEARASAHRHEENARELDRLETALAASRHSQPEGRLGRVP